MKQPHKLNTKGFTLVELMIATMVFSVVLLVMTAGVISIGKSFYKGYVTSKTQETTRSIVDEVGQAIQFAGGTVNTGVTPSGNVKGYCISSHLYSYVLNTPGSHQLVASPYNCPGGTVNALTAAQMNSGASGYRELLGKNMRLAKFRVEPVAGTNLYAITVKVIYTVDDNLLTVPVNPPNPADPADAVCAGGASSQFCATSEIKTTVQRRIVTGP